MAAWIHQTDDPQVGTINVSTKHSLMTMHLQFWTLWKISSSRIMCQLLSIHWAQRIETPGTAIKLFKVLSNIMYMSGEGFA